MSTPTPGHTLPPDGTLIELRDHLEALFDTYDMTPPEQKAEIEAEIAATLEAEVRKVDRISFYIATCERHAKGDKEEIERLRNRIAMWEHRVTRVRDYVKRVMEQSNTKKLEGDTATFYLRAATPAVIINDASLIPNDFKRTVVSVEIDKPAIRKAIEAGHDVPGADLALGGQTLVRK